MIADTLPSVPVTNSLNLRKEVARAVSACEVRVDACGQCDTALELLAFFEVAADVLRKLVPSVPLSTEEPLSKSRKGK